MIPSLSQEALTQYASNAQTIQEPTGADYSRGVSVGRTIPAKWWNWLFSNATKRIVQSRNDADNMLTELKNVVTDAGLTPSGSNNTQLTQAVQAKADEQIDKFIDNKSSAFLMKWTVQQLYLNDTEWNPTSDGYNPIVLNSDVYGTVFVSRIQVTDFNPHLAYSLDGIHWYSINITSVDATAGFCVVGKYLYMNQSQRNLLRADISSGTTVTTYEFLKGEDGSYRTTLIPFSDAVYYFSQAGILYKFTGESTVSETIDSTHLGQPTGVTVSSVVYPVQFGNRYYIGNVYTNLERTSWNVISATTADSSFKLGIQDVLLLDDTLIVKTALYSATKYCVINSQAEAQIVTTADVSSIAEFDFNVPGYVLARPDSYSNIYPMYSSDGISFTSFSFRMIRGIYTDGDYYIIASVDGRYGLYIISQRLSNNIADYTLITSSNFLLTCHGFVTEPYVILFNMGAATPFVTPLGTFYLNPCVCVIKKGAIMTPLPQIRWPDGTITDFAILDGNSNLSASPTVVKSVNTKSIGFILLDSGSARAPRITIQANRGTNFVSNHTLYLQ